MSQESNPHKLTRRRGMHTMTWATWKQIHTELALPMNFVSQTYGNAPQSAGYHKADGTFTNDRGKVEAYCAAFDVDLSNPHDYDGAQVGNLCIKSLHNLILCFWRLDSQGFDTPHIHAIDCRLEMKPELQLQVKEWLVNGDGLKGRRPDPFWIAYSRQANYRRLQDKVKAALRVSNPGAF